MPRGPGTCGPSSPVLFGASRNVQQEQDLYEDYLSSADLFHLLLRFVDASHAGRVPHVLVDPFKALLACYGVDCDLVVWCD